MDDKERMQLQRAAYSSAWQELRIHHCLREAAMVAHLTKRSSLRDGFLAAAGDVFDAVGIELEVAAELRPEWPREDEFALATDASPPPPTSDERR